MKIKLFAFFIFSILLLHKTKGQNNYRAITIDTDTVKSSWIKTHINNDSILTLEYKKIKYVDMPDIVDERIVYMDFRKKTLSKEIDKIKIQINTILEGKSYLGFYKTDTVGNKKNQYKEISNIYVPIYKLYNKYIVFIPDFEHPRIISDTAFIYKDDEGLLLYYFQDVSKENNSYKIDFHDFQRRLSQKEIQFYDRDKKIQVWKETHIGTNNKKFINYRLYIPLEEAINYPVLNIINTGGLDDIYDKFDDLELSNRY